MRLNYRQRKKIMKNRAILTACWFCGSPMVWGADFNADEVGTGSENQVAAELYCPCCGADATFTSAPEEV